MNPDQRSSGSVPTQPDPDSSKPEVDPSKRTLKRRLLGMAAVARTRCGADRNIQL